MTTTEEQIARPFTQVLRKAFIKRRLATTGLFEDDWQEITNDVKRWGTFDMSIDFVRANVFRFSNFSLKMRNDSGKYNDENNPSSLWSGYASKQRTLLRIEAPFFTLTNTGGLFTRSEQPQSAIWDESTWDQTTWDDNSIETIQFFGLISGDMPLNEVNEVTLKAKPLNQVFYDFPARQLTGFTSTGFTASDFMFLLRDQTDGSGQFIFRPFFGDTTSNWNIQTTTVNYPDLNTSTAQGIFDKTVWDVIENLSGAENFTPYISQGGIFNFKSKDPNTSTTAFEFYGNSFFNTVYGNTIKKINYYGYKLSNFYARVEIKFDEANTTSSYAINEAAFAVNGSNAAWNYGYKTLKIENLFLNTTTADTLASDIFQEVSSLSNELEFSTSYIPQLQLLDRVNVSYSANKRNQNSLWDLNSWDDNLLWDEESGNGIELDSEEFKIIGLKVDLEKLESTFRLKEI
jgi:hypothetical protein